MAGKVKTVVTFESSVFNASEQKEYFINSCCFGDDVANWLAAELRRRGYEVGQKPDQEDFGWYFIFRMSGIEYCFVIGYRPGDNKEDGIWIGWLERSRGLIASVLGARKRGIEAVAAQAIHEILTSSPKIGKIRWHLAHDFNAGREELGTPEPA